MAEQDDFIKSEDISLAKSIADHNVKVNSPNFELVDPISLQFSELAPNPSHLTYLMSIIVIISIVLLSPPYP